MDWLQFFASIIGSVARPVVAIVLLFPLRNRMAGLADRVEELAFGGAKAKFAKALGEGEANTAQVVATLRTEVLKPATSDMPEEEFIYDTAKDVPEAVIIDSFERVRSTLGNILPYFTKVLPTKGRTPLDVMEQLKKDGYIDENALELFTNLSTARNAFLHAGWGNRVTLGEASEYQRQANALNQLLRGVLARLKASPPKV